MSIALERPMTLGEFLLWEQGQDLRWEFDGFAPMAMTGALQIIRRCSATWRSRSAAAFAVSDASFTPPI